MVSGRLGRKTYKEQYAFIYRQVCSAGAARPRPAPARRPALLQHGDGVRRTPSSSAIPLQAKSGISETNLPVP